MPLSFARNEDAPASHQVAICSLGPRPPSLRSDRNAIEIAEKLGARDYKGIARAPGTAPSPRMGRPYRGSFPPSLISIKLRCR